MPTIIFIFGWQFYFFSNEGNESIIFMLARQKRLVNIGLICLIQDIVEDYAVGMSPNDKRKVKATIPENFDYIVEE